MVKTSHLQISQENSILRDTFSRRCKSFLTGGKGEFFDVKVGEFDDAYYNIRSQKKLPNLVILSLALPQSVDLPQGAADLVTQAYDSIAQGCVKVQHPGEDGYQLTLECDLAKITSEEQADLFCSKISTVRSLVQGIPLRRIFSDLQQGKSMERAAICMRYRQNRAMYVKPLVDSVVVVFPVHFEDENDATIAVNFLQHFAESKRTQQALSNSPSCTYHLSAPLEVQEAMKSFKSESSALKRDAEANGGYMSFSLFARHVSTKEKVDLCAWKMSTFYAFISYHIKASKGHIQSRMRTKADDWLGLLAKAKAAPPKKQPKTIRLHG